MLPDGNNEDYYSGTVSNGNVTITRYNGPGGDITVPSTLGSFLVISIDYGAFAGRASLTSVVIPDSVAAIGSYAFEGCTSLTSVVIGVSVTFIGISAFYNLHNTAIIYVPNQTIKTLASGKGVPDERIVIVALPSPSPSPLASPSPSPSSSSSPSPSTTASPSPSTSVSVSPSPTNSTSPSPSPGSSDTSPLPSPSPSPLTPPSPSMTSPSSGQSPSPSPDNPVSPGPSQPPDTSPGVSAPPSVPPDNPSPNPSTPPSKKTRLAKPKKLKLTAQKATWKSVKNNSGYTLVILQGKKNVRTVQIKKNRTSWKIPKKLFKRGKKYRFTLVAKGKDKYRNSKAAKSKVFRVKK
jgi:cytoskeletal protein RodZ